MGMCFSKKKKQQQQQQQQQQKQQQQQPLSPPPPLDKREEEKNVVVVVDVDEEQLVTTTKETRTATRTIARRADAEKKPVFVIAAASQKLKSTPSVFAASTTKEEEEEEEEEAAVGVVENNGESSNEKPAAVRTSSCSKEEVDAILIQCGRLSRSSSNKASPKDAGGGRRRYSGSKRSYDFDNDRSTGDRREDEGLENLPLPRPSPRRRTPSRAERAAGSGGGGSRRVSRSPGRRMSDDGAAAYSSASDKPRQLYHQQQPGKMVSVPAREKGAGTARRVSAAITAATSRSNSPAKNARMVTSWENAAAAAAVHQPQSLSRSNSRKAEQSPFRRNPMAEIDDNSVRPPSQSNTNRVQKIGRDGEEAIRKPSHHVQNQRSSDRRSCGGAGGGGGSMDVPKGSKSSSNCVREQLMSCRPQEKLQPEAAEAADDAAAAKTSTDLQENQNNPRTATRSCRSSRRSSKDFDANPPSSSYASLLLEDIQNYHQQSGGGFSLPACLSKACSILEAVADLNSSNSSGDNVRLGRGTFVPREPMVESDLTEPSLHKYISEMEPQESAGSNSFVAGQGQHWEPNSVSSTDRHWVNEGEEEVRKRSSGGGVSASNSLPRQLLRRGGREDCSLPVAAAAASATS